MMHHSGNSNPAVISIPQNVEPNDPPLLSEDMFSWLLLNSDDMSANKGSDMSLVGVQPIYNNQAISNQQLHNHQIPNQPMSNQQFSHPSNNQSYHQPRHYDPMLDEADIPLVPFRVTNEMGFVNRTQQGNSGELVAPLQLKLPPHRDVDMDQSNTPYSPCSEPDSFLHYPSPVSSPAGSDSFPDDDAPLRTRKRRTATPEQQAERIRRRLEKNRESARQCRRRKNEHMLALENRIQSLELENVNLRLRLKQQDKDDNNDAESEEMNKLVRQMEDLIHQDNDEDGLHNIIHTYKSRFFQFGKDKETALHYHLEQMERLLVPTQVTKAGLWTVENTNNSNDSAPVHDGSLWNVISKELELTEDQRKLIVENRETARRVRSDLKRSIQLVKELKENIDGKNISLDRQMGDLLKILTPKQTAKLILWVQNNPRCMYMLNSVWKSSI